MILEISGLVMISWKTHTLLKALNPLIQPHPGWINGLSYSNVISIMNQNNSPIWMRLVDDSNQTIINMIKVGRLPLSHSATFSGVHSATLMKDMMLVCNWVDGDDNQCNKKWSSFTCVFTSMFHKNLRWMNCRLVEWDFSKTAQNLCLAW